MKKLHNSGNPGRDFSQTEESAGGKSFQRAIESVIQSEK